MSGNPLLSKHEKAVVELLQADPVEFTSRVLYNADGSQAVPHEKQAEFLRGIKRFTVASCGRQWGKSTALAWYIVWFAVTHKARKVFIIAPSLDQSRIIYNEVARHFRDNPLLKKLVIGKSVEYPFPRLRLKNGSEIAGRGANSPQYIRGNTPHLVIGDEASFFKDGVIREAIRPSMTVTGQTEDAALILISTPFGEGEFKDMFEECQLEQSEGNDRYAAFHYPTSTNPYADKAELESVLRRYGEDSLIWKTEYLAEFVDSEMAVIPWKDIKWAVDNYPYRYENEPDPQDQDRTSLRPYRPVFPIPPESQHRYVQGADLADQYDYFVAAVADVTDSSLCTLVHYDRYNKRGWKAIKQTIRYNRERYNHAETIIDATSYGASVEEDLRDISAQGYKINSNQAKAEIVNELVRLFAEHRLVIPYDLTVINELRYFTYKLTPSKTLKMEASKGHDDIVIALALIAHLALIPSHVGTFKGVDTQTWTAHLNDKEDNLPYGRVITNRTLPDPSYDPNREAWEDSLTLV